MWENALELPQIFPRLGLFWVRRTYKHIQKKFSIYSDVYYLSGG